MSKQFQDSLDRMAEAAQTVLDGLLDEINKPSWSCHLCGATTTNPEHMLIEYFHMPCPRK